MSMKTTLKDAMKEAMRAKDKNRLSAIRLVQAEIKRVEVDERIDIDDARVLAILDKMVKQRRDSIAQYENAGRQELADIEIAEIAVIQDFLPTALTEAEIAELETESEATASKLDLRKKQFALLLHLVNELQGELAEEAATEAAEADAKAAEELEEGEMEEGEMEEGEMEEDEEEGALDPMEE